MSDDVFYDPGRVAIVPMGLCFPGTGESGDLPPRPECGPTWHERLMRSLGEIRMTLLVGQYAHRAHLGAPRSVTEAVASWRDDWPATVPLPHPSWRNNGWLRRNPWFETELLPELRAAIGAVLGSPGAKTPGRRLPVRH
jgi:uracil-DNA glycosylase